MHNIFFSPCLRNGSLLTGVMPFLKLYLCRRGMSLHGGSHSVLQVRFFELNCYNEVTCTEKFFVGPVEFVIKAFDSAQKKQ